MRSSCSLQLAALDEGLVSGVFGLPAERLPELRSFLSLPEDVHFVCVITIGHPQAGGVEGPSSRTTRRRLAVDELVAWERWDGD